MQLTSTLISKSTSLTYKVVYTDGDPRCVASNNIPIQSIHAFCFYKNMLVLVNHPRSGWVPPGGGVEKGERIEEAVIREVAEETNMRVIDQKIIGFQDIYEPNRITRQTRSVCVVEPMGHFHADPDGDIQEIKLIQPTEYKYYFDWGDIGDHIFKCAIELYPTMTARPL